MAATGFQSNQNRFNRWSKKVMLFSAHPTNDLIILFEWLLPVYLKYLNMENPN